MFHGVFMLTVILSIWSVNARTRSVFTRTHHSFGVPPISKDAILPSEEWFSQRLDHFNLTDSTTWRQRYYKNAGFFDSEKPRVFLMLGSAAEISPEWMVAGGWIDNAKKFKALCFQLEHRYYGKSHPTRDSSVNNLIYLTSEQAIADAAYFVVMMNEKYRFKPSVKWIIFGGFYSGSLAAWMRLKYPHLVYAAVASSAPLVAKFDFREFYPVITKAIEAVDSNCLQQIKLAFYQLSSTLGHPDDIRTLSKQLRLCDTINIHSKRDRSNLFENLVSIFAEVVQNNKNNIVYKTAKKSNVTIDEVCKIMTDSKQGNAFVRFSKVISMKLDANNENCVDYNYYNMIKNFHNYTWDSLANEGGRQWMFQLCNEFGFYPTSSGISEIISDEFPYEFFIDQCRDIFGATYNKKYLYRVTKKTFIKYGGFANKASRVIYVHGSVDPWHILGLTGYYENNSTALCIIGFGHCVNMYPEVRNETDYLMVSRIIIELFIGGWLDEP